MERENLLAALARAVAPSGCETEAARTILKSIAGLFDEAWTDGAGNLIVRLSSGKSRGKERLMLAAHMDEVGFMIKSIDAEGKARVALLGNLDTRVLSGRRIAMTSGVRGVVCTKPIHAQSGEERSKPTPADKLYIELGAKDRAQAETLVQIGDYGTLEPKFTPLAGGFYAGKALGGRSMCVLLCELLEKLHGMDKDKLAVDEIFFVFSAKREIARAQFAIETAAFTTRPDRAVLFDAAPAADFGDAPETARGASLGAGAVIAPADAGTLYDRALFAQAVSMAKARGIRYQHPASAALPGGEGKTVHKTASGIRTLSVGIPTRNLHSGAEIIQRSDYEAALSLACALVVAP